MIAAVKIDPATGLLAGVRQVLSPHCDARPAGVLPELLVVHGIRLRQLVGAMRPRVAEQEIKEMVA